MLNRTEELGESSKKLREEKQNTEKVLQELKEAQEKLVMSERTKFLGETALALGHHINNPLGILTLSVSAKLMSNPAGEEYKELMEWKAQHDRIADVIKKITELKDTKLTKAVGGKTILDIDYRIG